MLGVIAGDIVGSVYERRAVKHGDFPLFGNASRFTDDTVLTVATAHALLHGVPYPEAYHAYGRRYPNAGYGAAFRQWLRSEERQPYGSWGNGAAMRVGPIGWAATSLEQVLAEAERSAAATHDHLEGVRGAQAVALAIYLARQGAAKEELRRAVSERLGYDLSRTVENIRPSYRFDVSCQGSVPEAIIAFLDSTDFESAIRLAISLGGDADTQAAIAGGIAEAFYGKLPPAIAAEVRRRLPADLLEVCDDFTNKHVLPGAG